MNTDYLFIALSKTLLESCGQAFLIWLALKVFSRLAWRLSGAEAEASHSSAKNHCLVKYGALVLVFTSFIATLIYHVTHAPRSFQTLDFGYLQPAVFVQTSAGTEPSYLAMAESFLGVYSKWITLFYIAGLAIHTIWLLTGYFQVRNMANHSSHQRDNYWENRLEKLAVKLGISKKVKLYLSGINEIPFTTGFLKPIVLFPLAAINQLAPAQVEAILLHELAHIKRNDYLFNLIQQVMKTFLFFNPFAWLIDREIQREREYCCDDVVVAHSGDPETYASALLILEESRSVSPAFALASNNKMKYPLLYRIKRMIMKTPNSSPFPKLPIAILTLSIILSIAWAIPVSELKSHDKQATQMSSISKASSVIIPQQDEFMALPAKRMTKKIPVRAAKADTIAPARRKIKIVIEDEKGTKTEYSSVDEMPVDVKKGFLKNSFNATSFAFPDSAFNSFFNSTEWKKSMEEYSKHFNSPEWKKSQEDLAKAFSSPEWKKSIEEYAKHFSSPEWKKSQEELMKAFSSPEWKKSVEEMTKSMREMERRALKSQKQDEMILQDLKAIQSLYKQKESNKMDKKLEEEIERLQKKIESSKKEKPQ